MKLLASLLVIIVISDNHVSDAAVTLYQEPVGELVTELWLKEVNHYKRKNPTSLNLPHVILKDANPLCNNIFTALRMTKGLDIDNFNFTCQLKSEDDIKIIVMPIYPDAEIFRMTMIRPDICHCKYEIHPYYNDIYIYPRIHESEQYFVFEKYEGCQRVRAIFDSRTEVFSQPRLQPKNSLLNKMWSLLPGTSSNNK